MEGVLYVPHLHPSLLLAQKPLFFKAPHPATILCGQAPLSMTSITLQSSLGCWIFLPAL